METLVPALEEANLYQPNYRSEFVLENSVYPSYDSVLQRFCRIARENPRFSRDDLRRILNSFKGMYALLSSNFYFCI